MNTQTLALLVVFLVACALVAWNTGTIEGYVSYPSTLKDPRKWHGTGGVEPKGMVTTFDDKIGSFDNNLYDAVFTKTIDGKQRHVFPAAVHDVHYQDAKYKIFEVQFKDKSSDPWSNSLFLWIVDACAGCKEECYGISKEDRFLFDVHQTALDKLKWIGTTDPNKFGCKPYVRYRCVGEHK